MTRLGGWGVFGTGTLDQTTEYELFWGGDRAKGLILERSAVYSGTIRDAGNTPTTVIRGGLLVGQNATSSELEEWDADATDGTQNLYGVVPVEFRATDFDANNADRLLPVIVRAPLKASSLLIQGTAFTSHADEFLARRALWGMGCVLDDDPQGYLAGATQRMAIVTGTTDTLTEAENGSKIFYSNAASVTVTLPTLHAGLWYDLIRVANEEFIVTSAAGNDVIVGNDLTATSVTFTTANEHIGAWIRVQGVYYGTTLAWQMQMMAVPLGVGLDAWTYALA